MEGGYRRGKGRQCGAVLSICGGSEDQHSGHATGVPVDGVGHDPGGAGRHDTIGTVAGAILFHHLQSFGLSCSPGRWKPQQGRPRGEGGKEEEEKPGGRLLNY